MNWEEIKNDKNVKEYIRFLKNNREIYYTKDFPWIKYQGCLVPAIQGTYEPPKLRTSEVKKLLKKSRALFIRWSNSFTDKPTEWWYVVCKKFQKNLLSHNARNQIKRGNKNCRVKKITPAWLSQKGYDCYKTAFRRYKNAKPMSKEKFKENIMEKEGYNCFDFWGVFFNTKLVGYCECIKMFNTVSTSVIKYHPNYLKYYPSYTLIYTILNYYLNEKKYKLVSNGTRSIAHQTNVQKFLEKFDFEKQYCQLNVVYSPLLKNVIKILYPFRKTFEKFYKPIPINSLHKINVILKQEQIRRSFFEK